MRRLFILAVFALNLIGYSQKPNCDYDLLNDILPIFESPMQNTTIGIDEIPLQFKDQHKFFTKDFFEIYTQPILGVDNEKVKELIKTLDFEFLAKQEVSNDKWKLSKFKLKRVPFKEETEQSMSGRTQFRLARPIFTADKKMAFLYYHRLCGYSDCNSFGVRVYKKINGKWKYYVGFPMTSM